MAGRENNFNSDLPSHLQGGYLEDSVDFSSVDFSLSLDFRAHTDELPHSLLARSAEGTFRVPLSEADGLITSLLAFPRHLYLS